MDRIIFKGRIFSLYEYSKEEEFERDVISHSKEIFGENSIYIDIKKRIGKDNILTIPDGYLLDFSFANDPRLYIIENELVLHDPYRHIGQQLLKFAISYRASGRIIKSFLLNSIIKGRSKKEIVDKKLEKAGYRNIDALLEDLIFEKPVSAIVIIDRVTSDLESVLNQLTMKTDIIEFQTFIYQETKLYKYTPFQQEIRALVETKKPRVKIEDLDTIIVPANEDGFNEVFLGQDCWYAIRISSAMIDRIKYIVAYQTAPISAITFFAEVLKIEKYRNSGKYIVYFKSKAKPIGPIKLIARRRGAAPQSPRYTNFKRILKARKLSDVF